METPTTALKRLEAIAQALIDRKSASYEGLDEHRRFVGFTPDYDLVGYGREIQQLLAVLQNAAEVREKIGAVQRYDLEAEGESEYEDSIIEPHINEFKAPQGDWVRWEDIELILEQTTSTAGAPTA